jgi:hypothetical protein
MTFERIICRPAIKNDFGDFCGAGIGHLATIFQNSVHLNVNMCGDVDGLFLIPFLNRGVARFVVSTSMSVT